MDKNKGFEKYIADLLKAVSDDFIKAKENNDQNAIIAITSVMEGMRYVYDYYYSSVYRKTLGDILKDEFDK